MNEATLANAKAAGLAGITHLYNGMGPMSARSPGLAGLALADDDLSCGLICDDAHVSAAMIKLAIKAKSEGKVFLVSDAMPPAGQQPQQDFVLQGQKIFVKNGRCENADGTLAGCALTLFECVKIAVQKVGIPLERALAMASLYPAQFIGIDRHYGNLDAGARAEMIAFDSEMKLEKVIL
jgi:N-acetylglucosamine-6-phosphate deacetylase